VSLGLGQIMRRRDFIALVGYTAVARPLAAWAQQSSAMPVIGYLASSYSATRTRVDAFEQRLRELGWVDGKITIEYRWTEARNERMAELAAELVRLKVNVIVTPGTPPALAAKQATSAIPIVFVAAGDPVAVGLVASLARPGGNITGVSNQTKDTASKRAELLREAVPNLHRLAILANVGNPAAVLEMGEVQRAASTLGFEITTSEIRLAQDITPAIEALKGRADAIYVVIDALTTSNQLRINILALGARLPTMYGSRVQVSEGGLMSYGANFPDLFRRGAEFVDKVLRGEKPGDIPVEQPTKFDLVLNLTTAKALGLTIPETLLARADEVIE
jgi:putative tryptophan/tyrosine transport system substrate-binding protein